MSRGLGIGGYQSASMRPAKTELLFFNVEAFKKEVPELIEYINGKMSFSSVSNKLCRFILPDGREAELQIKIETDKSKFSDDE